MPGSPGSTTCEARVTSKPVNRSIPKARCCRERKARPSPTDRMLKEKKKWADTSLYRPRIWSMRPNWRKGALSLKTMAPWKCGRFKRCPRLNHRARERIPRETRRSPMNSEVNRLVDHFLRREAGKMVATLARTLGFENLHWRKTFGVVI